MKKLLALLLALLLIAAYSLAEDARLPLTESNEKLVIGLQQNSTVISFEDNAMTKWLEEKTGVDIEFEIFPANGTEAASKLQMMVTSGSKLPDIIFGCGVNDFVTLQNLADAGKIICLDDYLEDSYFIREWVEELSVEAPFAHYSDYVNYTKGLDGHSYALLAWSYSVQNCWAQRSWINTAWLDQLGLDIPKTTEELEYALEQFVSNDMNGNGLQDEIGIVGYASNNGIPNMMNMFCYVSDNKNGYFYVLDEDGQIQPQFITDEWRKGLSTLHEWVEKGIYSTLSFSQDSASLTALGCSDPLVAGIVCNATAGAIASNRANYTGLGVVTGPDGKGYFTYGPMLPSPIAVITSDCANPDLAFAFLDFLGGKEGNMANRYGVEGEDWTYIPNELLGEYKTFYTDIDGSVARFEISNNFWGSMQDRCWAQAGPIMLTNYMAVPADLNNTNNNGYMNAMHYAAVYPDLGNMDGLYYEQIIYSAEEIEKWAETRASLKSFINEQATYFVLGTLDVNDDEVWNNYINEAAKIGYVELIEADQVALDRTLGK